MAKTYFEPYKRYILSIITGTIVLLLIGDAIYYAGNVHSQYVRADMWRYIDMYLRPVYDNRFHWTSLWMDHHSQPLTVATFIVDSLYFNLSGNLFFYIGIFFKVLTGIFLIFLISKSIPKNNYIFLLLINVVGFQWFGLNSIIEYGWPLVTRANLWYFLMLLVFYSLDKILKQNNSNLNLLSYSIFSYLVVFINKSFGSLMIASILSILVFYFFNNKNKKTLLAKLAFVAVSAVIALKLFFLIYDISPHSSRLLFDFNEFSIIAFLNSFSIGLFSGLVKIGDLRKSIGDFNTLFFSYVLFVFYLYTIYYYITHKLLNKTIIPLALMFYSLFFILAVSLFRYYPLEDAVAWAVTAPRYTKAYEIGIIGMFWCWGIILNTDTKNIPNSNVLNIIVALLVLNSSFNIYKSWKASPYVRRSNTVVVDKLIKFYENNPENIRYPYPSIGRSFSYDKLDFLFKHKLNIFRNKTNDNGK